jgi:hypothetical protein
MSRRLKKNIAAEDAYVRSLERRGSLESVERGEARILSVADYPEPIKRFLERERRVLRLRLSRTSKRKLEQLGRTRGVQPDELARAWIEQRLAREAG